MRNLVIRQLLSTEVEGGEATSCFLHCAETASSFLVRGSSILRVRGEEQTLLAE